MSWNQTILNVDLCRRHEGEFHQNLLFLRAYNNGHPIYKSTVSGYANPDEILEKIHELNVSLVVKETGTNGASSYTFSRLEETIQVTAFENHVNITLMSLTEKWIEDAIENFSVVVQENPEKGSVMMLVADGGSMYLTELGSVDCPLERENYSSEIIKQYDSIIADLQTSTPSGRLSVLDGLPGTGKSFFIRGLITEVDALFVYIPASISGVLTGPEIIPVFLRERQKQIPIVLVMEDADATISTRQIDNISRLSDLLNMSDGLLGDMADIRIIATTNAKKNEIDDAALRVGRINEHVQFKQMDYAKAAEIFARLTGLTDGPEEAYNKLLRWSPNISLAAVYDLARQHGWKPTPVNKGRKRDGAMRSKLRSMLASGNRG